MPPTLKCPSFIHSRSYTKELCRTAQFRPFSSTPQRDQRITRARRQFFRWLNTQGQNFLNPASGHTNYMGAYNAQGQLKRVVENSQYKALEKKREKKDEEGGIARRDKYKDGKDEEKVKIPPETSRDLRPFPLNPTFVSQPVLSEELREKIWEKVMQEGDSVRDVSASLGVEMSRVGAVVRLMEIEKEWERVRKPLARPYARAIMSMLPQTKPAEPDTKYKPHESINDLPIHALTGPQIFHPTSESRRFTRADAAKVFDENLLPADDRVPHPELALMHRDFNAGIPKKQMQANQRARDELEEKKKAAMEARRLKKLAAVKAVDTGRWMFRFTDVNVDDAGKDGRGYKGVGWRYGKPHMDRSRGAVKIPTRVAL